jgi:hypothetical protein
VFLFDVYPRAERRARLPVAVGRIIVVVLIDLNKKYNMNEADARPAHIAQQKLGRSAIAHTKS